MTASRKVDIEQIRDSEWFDAEWYVTTYPDVQAVGLDPAEHYLTIGARLHRDPGPRFNSRFYVHDNPDVAVGGLNPLLHFLRIGKSQGLPTVEAESRRPSHIRPTSMKVQEKQDETKTVDPATLYASTFSVSRPFKHQPIPYLRHLIENYNKIRSRNIGNMKVAVFSAITGGFETQKIPEYLHNDFDYFMFTDGEMPEVGLFKILPIPYFDTDPRRVARYVKTHPHHLLSEYDVAIWIDSNIVTRGNAILAMLYDFVSSDCGVAAFPHPKRSSVYEESSECIRRGMDDEKVIERQMKRYEGAGFDCDDLIETNIMFYKLRRPSVIQFLDEWWKEIDRGSRRDQLSINFSLNAAGERWFPLDRKPRSVSSNPHFARLTHEPTSGNSEECVTALSQGLCNPFSGPPYSSVRADRVNMYKDISIDIVICIHNALPDVKSCLQSIDRVRRIRSQRLILVDDKSDDHVSRFLDDYSKKAPNVVVLRTEKRIGYTRAANLGLERSSAKVVILLNSDTIVTDGWAEKIVDAFYSGPKVGIVSPMSNAASYQSLPEIASSKGQTAINELPVGLTPEDMNRYCELWSAANFLPRTQLAHGFCFGISRDLINVIGHFDEKNFPHGYGEENDYCFRALEAGYSPVIATHTYIYHAKSKSYVGEERIKLMESGGSTLRRLYGDLYVDRAVNNMRQNPTLIHLRRKAQEIYKENKIVRSEPESPSALAGEGISRGKLPPASKKYPEVAKSLEVLKYARLSPGELERNHQHLTGLGAPSGPPSRVTWFLPWIGHLLRGGVRTVMMVADDFTKHWNTEHNFVIVDSQPHERDVRVLEKSINELFPRMKYSIHVFDQCGDIRQLPPSDIGICTLWTTAYTLVKYNQTGMKYYFMQDFEPAFYPAGDVYGAIEATYNFGFSCIANTKGVADIYRKYCNRVMYFTPGIDPGVFRAGDREFCERPIQVVFYGRPGNVRNGFALGVQALGIVKERMGEDVRIVAAGAEWSEKELGVEGIIENRGLLSSMDEVAALYRESAAGLVFMFTPHPSYQPLEYMASGCVPVVNRNAAHRWLLRDGENCVLVDPISEIVGDQIVQLLKDGERLKRIRANGLNTAKGLRWEAAFSNIRKFVVGEEVEGAISDKD